MPDFDLITRTLNGPFGAMPMARFLGDLGVRRRGAPLPADVERGRPRECFRNAWERSLCGHEYHEGWGWDPATGELPFHHAWCLDPATGAVVDPTWDCPETRLYLGVHVPANILSRVIEETRTFGILDHGCGFASDVAERVWGWTDRPRRRRARALPSRA